MRIFLLGFRKPADGNLQLIHNVLTSIFYNVRSDLENNISI